MTCIAWDGKTLAADKLLVNYGLKRTVTKIRRIGDLLVGGAGDFAEINEAMAWIERGRKIEDYPKRMSEKDADSTLLVIESGEILIYGFSPIPSRYEDKTYAMGSGRDYAITAMHLGKSAVEAVEIAIIFESGCGNGVDELTL